MPDAAPIAWARPALAAPALFCAVLARGASIVTHCRGRWQPSESDVYADDPPAAERCGGCVRELAFQARQVGDARRRYAELDHRMDEIAGKLRAAASLAELRVEPAHCAVPCSRWPECQCGEEIGPAADAGGGSTP